MSQNKANLQQRIQSINWFLEQQQISTLKNIPQKKNKKNSQS